MQQHPVPQAITTYKFRLVGNMTLKQFLELAFGVVIAWLIFSSGLNFFIKWTLGPLFGFLGFALAFVPIEDRPLDQWIINFFKAIYLPTRFIFKPQTKTMAIFSPAPPLPPKTNKAFANPAQLQEYLSTLPTSPATAFDEAEHKYLEHIYQLFGALGISRPAPIVKPEQPQPANPYKSNLKGVRVRKLFSPQICLLPHPASPAGGAAIFQAPPEPKQASMPLANSKSQILNPKKAPIPKIQIPKKPLAPPTKPITQTVSPTFASGVVMPHSLDKPNLITGIVLDKSGKIIPNVIIEIRDKQDLPVRALKSNKLGQFFTATPLSDGIYQIQAEQAGQKFAIIKLEAKNEIIPPLKIQAVA
ncbi:MAG: hypothetical protein UV54_C0049G0007 [Candidatus Beckwithbacteria bacterium GW2011_GWA2_43_10]|uniref:Uncharacterized protein n=1 Tax=Candidatus Beckwithbacteria bacterium GW2011_GWA2_43_10 TaxID=1618369 RepID=A0A0G1E715_9BACT|nr:MAG: hypothetical protein UV54_C0049G0007 [Candidatus Beckwithbacteria bacterium GW2011_GWA2_43_10]